MRRDIRVWMLMALARVAELKRREEGQTLVEYALILTLVSIVAVSLLTDLGSATTDKLQTVVDAF